MKAAMKRIAESEPLFIDLAVGEDVYEGVYMGFGISSRHELTECMPFDAMSMLLGGELIRRQLNLPKAAVIIADEEAKTNGFDVAEIDRIARYRTELLQKISENLCFRGWNFLLSSDMVREPDYEEILKCLDGMPYEKIQLADMEYMRRRKYSIKIGWEHKAMEFDERYFDGLYASAFGNTKTFAYVEPGRMLDGTPAPPYLHGNRKERLFLEEGEDTGLKVGMSSKRVGAYLNRILDLFDKMVCGESRRYQNTQNTLNKRLQSAYSVIFGKE